MSEFFAMGGHGYYIWMSYGVTASFMIIEVIVVVRAKQALHRRLTRLARAETHNP